MDEDRELRMLAAGAVRRTVTTIAVTIYEYDPVVQGYYPGFTSYGGTAPNGSRPRSTPQPLPEDTRVVYGQLATASALRIAGARPRIRPAPPASRWR